MSIALQEADIAKWERGYQQGSGSTNGYLVGA